MRPQTLALTLLALMAFAANSVLCRLALKAELIDPVSFTQIRLAAGAVVLAPLLFIKHRGIGPLEARRWGAALMLFLYAIGFSLAYTRLDVGSGALILFGAVQVSMIGWGIVRGQRLATLQGLGVALAFGGLVYLFLPGLSAPPLVPAILMTLAGVAWGAYSLLGRGETDHITATARNFVLTLPFVLLLFLGDGARHAEASGVMLAVASGAVASGAGYVVWYWVLRSLAPVNAAVGQLAVPVIAALGGAVVLGEAPSVRLGLAAVLILGGILIVVRSKAKAAFP